MSNPAKQPRLDEVPTAALQAVLPALARAFPVEELRNPAAIATEQGRLDAAYRAGRADVVEQIRSTLAQRQQKLEP